MSREQKFSDEFLSAFVDDQLETEEKNRVYLEIGQDEELDRRVCELRKLRKLVRLSYENPPLPENGLSQTAASRHVRVRFNIAAGLTLVLGVLLGWFLHESLTSPGASVSTASPVPQTKLAKSIAANPVQKTPKAQPGLAAAPTGKQMKVLIHVSEGGRENAKRVLDEVENLLRFYRESRQNARVEVVINSDGLDLVRADIAAFPKRIIQLQKEYDNLTFAACRNTIDRLKRERGITAQLLPGVVVIDSGVAQIMRRQHQGWAYIQG